MDRSKRLSAFFFQTSNGSEPVRDWLLGLDRMDRRVIFCIHDSLMILLHGFIKKSQTIPKPDLDLALNRQKQLE